MTTTGDTPSGIPGSSSAEEQARLAAAAERAAEQGLLFADDVRALPEDIGYRGPTVCAAAGITYRQLDYWARTGLVEPGIRAASGSGTQRLYGFRDVLVLKIVKRLLDTGVSLQQIRVAVQHLRDRGIDDLAQITLMSDGASVYECTSADEVIDLVQGGQGVLDRIGVMAWSLGGYYAPRAAAFEKRFKLVVAWGANYNWGELQKRRLANEGDRPVPHYWDHVQWVFGKDTLEEFMEFAPSMSLVGVVDQITVPFLITHGEDDRQIPVEYAHAQYGNAINSPDRELKFFTKAEGGSMHASADNMCVASSFISDWVHDRL